MIVAINRGDALGGYVFLSTVSNYITDFRILQRVDNAVIAFDSVGMKNSLRILVYP